MTSSHAARPARRGRTAARRVAALVATVLAGAAALAAAPAQALPAGADAPAAAHACGRAVPGAVRCLAAFRSVQAARRAGVPAGSAAGQRHAAAPGSVSLPAAGYGPADVRSMYALDVSRGAGQTVAVVDAYDNPNAEKDLATFRTAYRLGACTTANGCFRKVDQRGGAATPAPDAGWGLEIALDVQAVSAACPRCRILLVEADSADLADIGTAVNRAVALGATVVSNSYGGDEYSAVLGLGKRYYTHPGVAMVASSGDAGFGPASFPASWGSALAVGGTSVTRTASGWKQTAWSGAGSGCSAWVAKPAWQKDAHCLMRTTSDLSALADPDTGLAVYDTYGGDELGFDPGWVVVGGTSLAAPLVSGMIALAGNAPSLGSARYVYDHRSGLTDVVRGSNAGWMDCGGDYLCTAKKGYDGPTGLGTPRGVSAL